MSRTVECRLNETVPRFVFRAANAPEENRPSLAYGLLLLFFILLYSNISKMYPFLEAFRPTLAVAVVAAFLMVLELARAKGTFRLTWPQGYLLIAFIGVALVSSFGAIYARKAFQTTSDIAKILIIYLLIENTVNNEKRVRTVLWTLVIGGLFPAIGTISNFLRGITVEETRASWIGIFKNPNENAYALVMLVPLAAMLAKTSTRFFRVALWGVILTYVGAIYLTYSRGGLLGLFGVVALLGWKQKSVALRTLMAAGLVVSLAAVGLFWNRKDDFKDLGNDTTVNQRIATMKAGVAMFIDKPLLGVGPGCSLVAYPLYVPKEAHCGCQDQLIIHNAFLQVLSEIGLIGFIPFATLFAVTILQLQKMQRGSGSPAAESIPKYAMGLELAIWGFVLCGMSGGFSYTWFPYILAGLAVATKRVFDSTRVEVE